MTESNTSEQPNCLLPVFIALVLITGLFLRIVFMTGPYGGDDTRYFDFAHKFLNFSPFDNVDHAAGRILFLMLIGWPIKLFGHAVFGALVNIAYATLTDVIVVLFCLKNFGKHATLWASLLLVFNPISIIFSGLVLPDTTMTLFLLLAVMATFKALKIESQFSRYIWFALSGFLTGLAYMCKETAILILPIICLTLFFAPAEKNTKERFVGPIIFVALFVLVYVLDGLLFVYYTGDFFYKIHATSSVHNVHHQALPLFEFLLKGANGFMQFLEYKRLIFIPIIIGIPTMALSIVCVPKYRIFAAVGIFIPFYLFFGTSSLSKLYNLPMDPRYLGPHIPYAAICFAALVQKMRISNFIIFKLLVPVTMGIFLVYVGWKPIRDYAGIKFRAYVFKSYRAALESLPQDGKPVYVGSKGHKKRLKYFVTPEQWERTRATPKGELPSGYYLVVNNNKITSVQYDEIRKLKLIMHIQMDWRNSNFFRTQPVNQSRFFSVFVHEKEGPKDREPFPDLVLKDIKCSHKPQIEGCQLVIANNSAYAAKPFNVEIRYSDKPELTAELVNFQFIPGWEYQYKRFIPPLSWTDEKKIHITINPGKVIKERDFINNVITWESGL